MENREIAEKIKLLGQIQELHGSNPFKIKALINAAYTISKYPHVLQSLDRQILSEIPGFGASIYSKIIEILDTGRLQELNEWLKKTPEGVVEMLRIKGLGPKKAQILWKELGLESLGEVLYACNENRLIEAKGFGLKTQEQIRDAIQFTINNSGWFLYANVEKTALSWLDITKKHFGTSGKVSFTGEIRRKNEVLQTIEILIGSDKTSMNEFLENTVRAHAGKDLNVQFDRSDSWLISTSEDSCPIRFYHCDLDDFVQTLFETTGNNEHVSAILGRLEEHANKQNITREEDYYTITGLSYIEPEMREGLGEIEKAKSQKLPTLIELADLKGSLHNHSTYSDGVQSLREMAIYCRDHLKLEYFGIADHSQTAVYAGGLSAEKVQQQWIEIDQLNMELAPFKILKGIESDILNDGSLDYPDEILAGFDYVVASVHSNLHMDEDKATERLLRAIANPFTTILGHPTGRLLLSRKGYPIDHKTIIDACAKHNVVIEINANPLRLDLDWRWYDYAMSQGALLSINPDAHRTAGFHDMQYGIYAARKGGVSREFCLNSLSLTEIITYLSRRKK